MAGTDDANSKFTKDTIKKNETENRFDGLRDIVAAQNVSYPAFAKMLDIPLKDLKGEVQELFDPGKPKQK